MLFLLGRLQLSELVQVAHSNEAQTEFVVVSARIIADAVSAAVIVQSGVCQDGNNYTDFETQLLDCLPDKRSRQR
jgi:hypothetical protein